MFKGKHRRVFFIDDQGRRYNNRVNRAATCVCHKQFLKAFEELDEGKLLAAGSGISGIEIADRVAVWMISVRWHKWFVDWKYFYRISAKCFPISSFFG